MTTKKAYRYDPSASYAVTEHDVEYLNVDGITRLVRIYQPEGPGPFPMLLSIHGGAWTDKDHTEYESTSTPLAATGIVVAAIGQRVGKGFPYPVQLQDINYGVRWLKAHASDFNGDPDSVGGIGYSSGGHTLPLAAMRPTDPRYSALPLEGSSQVDANFAFTISCWPVIEPYFRYEIAREKGNTDLMEKHHIFFQGDEAMHESTPINIIQSGEKVTLPPAMVMHGTADDVMPIEASERFVAAYNGAGGKAQLVPWQGKGHGWARAAGPEADEFVKIASEFIAKQLG
ncbi:MAG: alpha/beta hydrolase [Dehalococcoidia bacterium]|nr:alpha/beta hydrolase [Dehalococcoidia bacterium]